MRLALIEGHEVVNVDKLTYVASETNITGTFTLLLAARADHERRPNLRFHRISTKARYAANALAAATPGSTQAPITVWSKRRSSSA